LNVTENHKEHDMATTPAHQVIVITGASSGFGALSARALARAGHTVYAGMRDTDKRNAPAVDAALTDAATEGFDLRPIDLDVASQNSVDTAITTIVADAGRVDVVIHNAGHMVLGPAEAFTAEEFHALYDTNVVGAQRVNRAALPHLRRQGSGLVLWVGSSSTRGGVPPFLAPYFAAKAGMDALAVSYAAELIRFGIDTSIVVPGAYTSGTNHFTHAGIPGDAHRAAEYDELYGALRRDLNVSLAAIFPDGHDVSEVADEIVRIVNLPAGRRPFRVHIDPTRDGSEVVSAVADRIRSEFYRRVGIEDLLPTFANL
jgi:NAD(P)-dependent dehydrogenase (short-subunit alcohol dehydrogenase family)